jgi:hypothetical protein
VEKFTIAIILLTLGFSTAHAQSVKLRYDWLSGDASNVITIDLGRKQVEWGAGEKAGTYENRSFIDDSDGPSTPTDLDDEGRSMGDAYVHCTYNVKEYVTITDNSVNFGYEKISVGACGFGTVDQTDFEDYSLDKNTGVLSRDDNNIAQCRQWSAPAAP